ncbi:Protein SON like [Melia azedarach]|uniref:Protein SON like n=1 Tax=Melia azedarach TaxID=155640 RepID=A0ACC1XBK4_MELAZ|nr:Protein SON like [Melia azedarach]
MEETRKRGSEQKDDEDDDEDSSSCSVKRPRGGAGQHVDGGEDLGDDVMTWLSMDDDDTMSQLLNLLDNTSTTSNVDSDSETLTRVKFIDNPYSSPLIFQSSSSYVTINGNEESCGSSFSDSESSLMVSVDMGGIVNVGGSGRFEVGACSWTGSDCGGFLKGGEIEHCNGSDLGDEFALARFLMEETQTVC